MLIADKINIKRHFHGELRLCIKDLSLNLELGKITSIIGQSGIGKSTIASILSGLLQPDSGEVKFENNTVIQPKAPISYVIQDYRNAVFPWLTVEDNIRLATHKPIHKALSFSYDQIIEMLHIPTEIVKEHPNHLSGGQIQRVQIARALFSGCQYIILDEPTSSLDMKFRSDLQALLISIVKKFNIGILLITHNIEEAIFLSDTVFVAKESNDKIVSLRRYRGFSHKRHNISEAQEESEYRSLFNTIYQHLFYENQKRG